MISRLVVAALLAAVWVALWGEASPANILAGLAVGAGVQLLLGRHIGTAIAGGILRPVALARFTGVFAVELVVAAAQVAWEVVTPRNVDTPAVVEVDLATSSPTVVTAVANAVSLTPGTVTIEVNHREGHAPATLLKIVRYPGVPDSAPSRQGVGSHKDPGRAHPALDRTGQPRSAGRIPRRVGRRSARRRRPHRQHR